MSQIEIPSNILIFTKNIKKGKIAEELAKQDYRNNGYKIIPTKVGSDFVAIKKTNGRLQKEFVEVKTGNSTLSKLQKKTRNQVKKQGFRYTIYHVSKTFLEHYFAIQEIENAL